MKNLLGIHHVTAITSSAEKIYDFYTNVLGMRLVKKTINQDDIHTYHLFFADDEGNPGTDITFFDFSGISQKIEGVNEISRTGFRVTSDEALEYWLKRFKKYQVVHEEVTEMLGKKVLYFEDFDEQKYALFSDETNVGVESGKAWKKGPVPNEYAITGLGPIFLRINNLTAMHKALVDGLEMRKSQVEGNLHLYEMGEGGNGASVILEVVEGTNRGVQGYGAVHHVAFRVKDEQALSYWIKRIGMLGLSNSGHVDRFYFKSLYTRMYPGILFEFATDGPGFIDDEKDYEILGETLALPPKFRHQREYIEKLVRPIDTVRSNKVFEKEYL
ncbi:MAG: VOC family protein [Bacilli bacterium]|jgi:glyoxalase family protein|nr:VOC family protein [Bacilli bacterium]HHU24059.1 ring-cleaving dioxygenase [Acholeplasmataceae bacterium]